MVLVARGERAPDIEPLYERPNRCNMLAEAVRKYIDNGFDADFAHEDFAAMRAALEAYDTGHPTSWVFKDGQVVRDSTD